METNTDYIISVQDLVKEYNDGKVVALNHCNLDIKKGEVVAIIGHFRLRKIHDAEKFKPVGRTHIWCDLF